MTRQRCTPAAEQVSISSNSSGRSPESAAFSRPSVAELVMIRRLVETNQHERLKDTIWAKPTLIINDGDVPTIVFEGMRYNAIHVASDKGSAKCLRVLLDTIKDPKFMKLLSPLDDEESRERRIENVLMSYLNIPNKLANETPLHLASKFGREEVIELLVSEPLADLNRVNANGDTPLQVLGARADPKLSPEKRRRLEQVLSRGLFYIPVFTSDDPCGPTKLGKTVAVRDYPLPRSADNVSFGSNTHLSSALNLTGYENADDFRVVAYAGLMTEIEAQSFRQRWKGIIPEKRTKNGRLRRQVLCAPTFTSRPYEFLGRPVAQDMKISLAEYWPFLRNFADLTKESGLQLLEDFLEEKRAAYLPASIQDSKEGGYLELEEILHQTRIGLNGCLVPSRSPLFTPNTSTSSAEALSPDISRLCHSFRLLKVSPAVSAGSNASSLGNSSKSVSAKGFRNTSKPISPKSTPRSSKPTLIPRNLSLGTTEDCEENNDHFHDNPAVKAASEGKGEQFFNPPLGKAVFLYGPQPSADDFEAYLVIRNLSNETLTKFPMVSLWKSQLDLIHIIDPNQDNESLTKLGPTEQCGAA